jgi:hypothetical protein
LPPPLPPPSRSPRHRPLCRNRFPAGRHRGSRSAGRAAAALAAVAVLVTVLLTKDKPQTVSQEELVRTTIQNFDTSILKGDLATLRSITCGETADNYIKYDATQWKDIHAKIAAARQYPVIASIDQVVVHDNNHAEANVTTYMAFDPSTRSTRSFDLEFRDEKWKICQAPS